MSKEVSGRTGPLKEVSIVFAGESCGDLKVDVHASSRCPYRAAIVVISRIAYKLHLSRGKNPAPDMGGVIRLPYVLPTVTQRAVAEQEALTAEPKIFGVLITKAVADESGANLIELSMPLLSSQINTYQARIVGFR